MSRRLGCVLVAACLLLGVPAARGDTVTGTDAATGADAVLDWVAVMEAHRALASLYPDQATSLDAHRVASLAAIADGSAKDAGIAVGDAAALAVLAKRTDDGSNDDTPYTPGTAPGRYRPTPPDFTPAFRPGLGQVDTFAIKSGAQFRGCWAWRSSTPRSPASTAGTSTTSGAR
jgi:hypothetical protein